MFRSGCASSKTVLSPRFEYTKGHCQREDWSRAKFSTYVIDIIIALRTLAHQLQGTKPQGLTLTSWGFTYFQVLSYSIMSSHDTNDYTTIDAKAPFDPSNSNDADIILRSHDNVDFRVIKLFLSYSSPFFRAMFDMPQPLLPSTSNSNEVKDGLPIIIVSEAGDTLDRLLRLCYPMAVVESPVPDTLEDIHLLLEATIKYEVERAEKQVRMWLIAPHILDTDPVRVFAIATRYKLREEATAAAKASFNRPLLKRPYGPELELITGGQLYQLLQYHERCRDAVRSLAIDFLWVERSDFCWFNGGECESGYTMRKIGPSRRYCSKWWVSYTESVVNQSAEQSLDDASKEGLMEIALTSAAECRHCCPRVWKEMREFSEILMAKIEKAVSEVGYAFLVIPTCSPIIPTDFVRSSVLALRPEA